MAVYQCAKCTTRLCRTEDPESDKLPLFCPMRNEDAIKEGVKRYAKEDLGGYTTLQRWANGRHTNVYVESPWR